MNGLSETKEPIDAYRAKLKTLSDQELALLSQLVSRQRADTYEELTILAEDIAQRYAQHVRQMHSLN